MSAEQHKSLDIETRREVLGRWGQVAGLLGGAAIALANWSIAAGIPFFFYTEAGSTVLKFWGKQSRNKPKRESFFKRRKIHAKAGAGGH